MTIPKIVRPPDTAARPLVISSPHSGRQFPREEQALYAVPLVSLQNSGDLYVDELYKGCEAFGATFISTPISRFVVDVNRLRDDLSPESVEGAIARRGEGYYGARGLLWSRSSTGGSIYARRLTQTELERRQTRYYDPYHAALRVELERLRARFGYVVLLDAHSMPSHSIGVDGVRRADVVPGDLVGRTCGHWLSAFTESYWRQAGFSVARNMPYQGGGIVRQHGAPEAGVHALQLELNRDLYLDERTYRRGAGMPRLRQVCQDFAYQLANVRVPAT